MKTLDWYQEGGLEQTLSDEVNRILRNAVLAFHPETAPAPKLSTRLA